MQDAARPRVGFVSTAPCEMPRCVVPVSGRWIPLVRRAVCVWSFVCPGPPHRRIPRSCGLSPLPHLSSVDGGERPRASPWTGRLQWPAWKISLRARHGEPCEFPRARTRPPGWLSTFQRAGPVWPFSSSSVPASSFSRSRFRFLEHQRPVQENGPSSIDLATAARRATVRVEPMWMGSQPSSSAGRRIPDRAPIGHVYPP